MMYSAYKLNKQGDNIQPWHTPFPKYCCTDFPKVCCSMSSSICCFLSRIQMSQETGSVFCYSHLFENFPVCCDPHSKRLPCSQWSRSRFFFFSGTPLLSPWSSECWQVDLWFLCLFKMQPVHLEVLSSHAAEAYLDKHGSIWNECNCMVSLNILWHCPSLKL